MLAFLKRKPAKSHASPLPEQPAPVVRKSLPVKMANGHATWNIALEEELKRGLDALGIPLGYQPVAGGKAPPAAECDRYGYESLMGKSALDEGILLRRFGCKQLYPRFLAILAKTPLYVLAKPTGEVFKKSGDQPQVAVFTSVYRAQDGQRGEGAEYSEIVERTGEALLKRYPKHGLLLNLASPGATFAVPPEVAEQISHTLGLS